HYLIHTGINTHPTSTLFPYPTLFRSTPLRRPEIAVVLPRPTHPPVSTRDYRPWKIPPAQTWRYDPAGRGFERLRPHLAKVQNDRSEERRVGKECRYRWTP